MSTTVVPGPQTGNEPGSSGNGPVTGGGAPLSTETGGPVVFTPEQQAFINTLMGTVRTEARAKWEREAQAAAQNQAQQAQAQAAQAAEEARLKALKETGDYKALYQNLENEVKAIKEAAERGRVAGLRLKVATTVFEGRSAQEVASLAEFLAGDTEEALTVSAKTLLALSGPPKAPVVTTGRGPRVSTEKQEQAHIATAMGNHPRYNAL